MGQPARGCLTTGPEVPCAAALRVAVYTDAVYRRVDGRVYADETFSVFAARLRPQVARLLLVGRSPTATGAGAPRGGNLLPDDVELLPLPHYSSLVSPRSLPPLVRSVRLFWRALDDLDAVWLLGPHPLALTFALVARLRHRRVVLGVRQDLLAYARDRRAGSRAVWVAAGLLEHRWRRLARRHPVAVVGPELARQYAGACQVVEIAVSLVEEEDLARTPAVEALLPRRLLSVGRLDPEKNPLLLADVLALLHAQDPRWSLVVCGDGPLEGALRTRLEDLGLGGAAELLGKVPLAELERWYRRSDALVHVSWTEGFPQVLLEAFAHGLPVVATAVGGVPGLARGSALLVPPGDAVALAAALESLEDPAVRRALVAAGMRTARAHTGTSQRESVLALLCARGT